MGGLVRELFRKLVAPVQITVWPQNTSPVHCRDQPNTTENLQCLDARIPTPSRESPSPVDTAARLRNISSGFCRGYRDYSEITPFRGALIPTPSLLSPAPVDTAARPPSTSPGCRRVKPIVHFYRRLRML